jgi:hypothetical protein
VKKWVRLYTVILLPFTIYAGWDCLTDLQHRNLIISIGRCRNESLKYQGAERIRAFVTALDKVQPGPVSGDVRAEFEHYKALWDASLITYDKTGSFGNYDKDIEASAQRLKGL